MGKKEKDIEGIVVSSRIYYGRLYTIIRSDDGIKYFTFKKFKRFLNEDMVDEDIKKIAKAIHGKRVRINIFRKKGWLYKVTSDYKIINENDS